ncbi:MAG: hypothetical protein WCT27_01405 [Patescibacteria group bacterium]|jgi:hypothetical protein
MLHYLVFLGAAVSLFGTFSYIRDTLKGITKPNRVSWLLWSITPLIGAAAAFADGIRWAALPIFMAGFGPILVFIASFVNKNSYWKLGKHDYICGVLSVLALVLWGITNNPTLAIIFAIAGDAFAAIPTLQKSWTHPETESGIVYVTALFNVMTSFAAMKIWSLSEIAFPIYLIFINISLLFAVYRKKYILKSWNNKSHTNHTIS